MKRVDRILADWRIRKAVAQIPPSARVLDVGCHDGRLFRVMGPRLGEGVGIDETLTEPVEGDRYRLVAGTFPEDLDEEYGTFDAITMLALFEHVPTSEQDAVLDACRRWLSPGGRLVLTVPSPQVDRIIDLLLKARLSDPELGHHQHHGFEPTDLRPLLAAHGFELVLAKRFQLGLNNLFVGARTE